MEKAINELHSIASKYRTSDIEEKEDSSLDINPIFMIHDEFQLWLLKSEYICNWLGAYINPLSASVFLVSEYMKYGNLEDQINLGVKPDESSIGAVAYVLLNALIELHSHNCIHRDIRPTNILVGNNGKLKVSYSFVISKYDNVGGERSFNDIMYMSPERVKDESYTTSTDIWSLGILLIRYSTNCIPYSATSHWELAENITKGEISMVGVENFSLDLRAFISQCIQQQPNQRASAQDLLQHPFIQTYISDQVIKGQDLTCISKYSKCCEDSYKIFDLEQSLEAIFSRNMEDKLLQLWIDPSASHFLKPKPNSDLEFLSQQLNIDVEYTKARYSEMMISTNILLKKHFIALMRLNKNSFEPPFIVPLVQLTRELVNKDINAIGKGLKETDTLPQILNVIVPENNDAEAKSENLDEILVSFRIPPADAKRYAESLINIGYDDMQSIKEDLDIQTLETIMKPGHVIRFLKNKDSMKPIQPKKTSLELAKFNDVEDVLGIPLKALNLPPHQVSQLTEESIKLKIKVDEYSKYSTKTIYDIKEINRGDWYICLAFVRPSLDIVAVKRYSNVHGPKQCIIFKELEVLSKLKENNQRFPWVAKTFNDIWSVNSPYFVSFHNAYLDKEGVCLVYEYMDGILLS